VNLRRCALANLTASTFLGGVGILYRFSPEEYSFYPQCPVFRYLHVLCPGCGATRALAALLHLRFEAAIHYNAFVVVLLPLLTAYFALAYWRACRDDHFVWPTIPAFGIAAALMAALVFAVVRNAPAFFS